MFHRAGSGILHTGVQEQLGPRRGPLIESRNASELFTECDPFDRIDVSKSRGSDFFGLRRIRIGGHDVRDR